MQKDRDSSLIWISLLYDLLLVFIIIIIEYIYIKRTFAGCHKCTKNSYTWNNNDFS